MPDAPATPCTYPGGCAEYAVSAGRCASHARAREQARGSSTERHYDGAWRRFREWFIHRHPICQDCGHVPTKEVHHVRKVKEYPELRLVESNCRGLCKPCHSVRTQRGE